MAKSKPVVALRKPPEAAPEAVNTFVFGDAQKTKRPGAQTVKRSDVQTSGKAVVKRADGRELRRMTVYLPTDLAAQLRVHCAEADIDLSEFVAQAVAGRLGA